MKIGAELTDVGIEVPGLIGFDSRGSRLHPVHLSPDTSGTGIVGNGAECPCQQRVCLTGTGAKLAQVKHGPDRRIHLDIALDRCSQHGDGVTHGAKRVHHNGSRRILGSRGHPQQTVGVTHHAVHA